MQNTLVKRLEAQRMAKVTRLRLQAHAPAHADIFATPRAFASSHAARPDLASNSAVKVTPSGAAILTTG